MTAFNIYRHELTGVGRRGAVYNELLYSNFQIINFIIVLFDKFLLPTQGIFIFVNVVHDLIVMFPEIYVQVCYFLTHILSEVEGSGFVSLAFRCVQMSSKASNQITHDSPFPGV